MRKYNKFTEKEKAYIREHLPQSTYAQVARDLGRPAVSVLQHARAHGISHNKALANRIKGANLEHSERLNAKVSEAIQEKYRKERLRLKWGLEQKTKWRVGRAPKRVVVARSRLKCNYNYVLENLQLCYDANPYAIYYDSETRRSPNEAYFTEKYGFKFLPLDE